jgi:hypothetical protein
LESRATGHARAKKLRSIFPFQINRMSPTKAELGGLFGTFSPWKLRLPFRRGAGAAPTVKPYQLSYFGVVKDIDEHVLSNATTPLPSVTLPERAVADPARHAIVAPDLVPHRNGAR